MALGDWERLWGNLLQILREISHCTPHARQASPRLTLDKGIHCESACNIAPSAKSAVEELTDV